MKGTRRKSWHRGGATIMEGDHIVPWPPAFPIRGWPPCRSSPADTAFRSVIESCPDRSWADCITNTECRALRHEAPEERCWQQDCLAGCAAFGAATDPVDPLVRSAEPYLPGLRP